MARPADPNAREALIAAARAEFARRGLRGARIEDITAACGLSKGAFYLHFPTKESLFGELVAKFDREMGQCNERRIRIARAFRARYGPLGRRDVHVRSARYRRMLEIEQEEDLRTLELMWTYRDVMGVLMTGAQGTQFEQAIWQLLERETSRIAADLHEMRCHDAIRSDIPSDIFAALVVGTYFAVAHRLTRMTEKPDLRAWSRSLQTLIREGSAPTASSERATRRAAPARGLQHAARTARRPRRSGTRTRPKHRSPP